MIHNDAVGDVNRDSILNGKGPSIMTTISKCTTAIIVALLLASGVSTSSRAEPTGTKVPISGTWEDLAGRLSWSSEMDLSADMSTFEGTLAPGMEVRGTRNGSNVTAVISANGKEIGRFQGTLDEHGTVKGEYSIAGESQPVAGKAVWKAD